MSLPEARTDDATLWRVEAWRGLAAWMVVYAHYSPAAGVNVAWLKFSFTGVDLFFVLSGFVFAPYFFGKPLEVRSFAVRRFFRIYPAFIVALAVYMGLKAASGLELKFVWQHMVFAYVQTREMAFYYNPAFWSLPSEVEFYLLLPLLAALTRRQSGAVATLFAAALVMRLALGYGSNRELENQAFLGMYHLPGVLLEFLLGVVAWRFSQRAMSVGQKIALASVGGIGWIGLACVFGELGDAGIDATLARGQMSWLAACCFAMLLTATAQTRKKPHRWLVTSCVWAGRLSYGTYLLHFAALTLALRFAAAWGPTMTVLAACAGTLGGAWVVYRAWENPWRQYGRTLARRWL